MARVTVALDAEARRLPLQARQVRTASRRPRLRSHQHTRKGDPDAPLTDQDLSDKFMELAADAIGAAPARALLAQLWEGQGLPGVVLLLGQQVRAAE